MSETTKLDAAERYLNELRYERPPVREVLDIARQIMVRSSRDWSASEDDAYLYGVLAGWPDEAIVDVVKKHAWTPSQFARLRALHDAAMAAMNRQPTQIGPLPTGEALAFDGAKLSLALCSFANEALAAAMLFHRERDHQKEWAESCDGNLRLMERILKLADGFARLSQTTNTGQTGQREG